MKGVDRKTTLLEFVMKRILSSEVDVARKSNINKGNNFFTYSPPEELEEQQLWFLEGGGVKHIPPEVEKQLRFVEGVGLKYIPPHLGLPVTSLQKARTTNNQLGKLIDDGNEIGMEVILRLPSELSNVTRAGGLNAAYLKAAIPKLVNGLQRIKTQVQEGCFTATQGME